MCGAGIRKDNAAMKIRRDKHNEALARFANAEAFRNKDR